MKNPSTVMVIEDDPSLRETICSVLTDAGHETLPMADGVEAMEYLSSSRIKPDIILLDLMMPEMDGWQFRETQLMVSDSALIPVVVMTSSRDLKSIKADDVLFKPFDVDKLLAVIDRHAGVVPSEDKDKVVLLTSSVTRRQQESQPPRIVEAEFENGEQSPNESEHKDDRAIKKHDTFLDIVCHDLRNPLNSIMLAAGQLSRGVPPESQSNSIARILENVRHMQGMISQLLNYTRVQTGRQMQLQPTHLDLSELSKSTVSGLQKVYGNEIRIVDEGDCSGTWDREKLAELLGHLVTNACQHGVTQSPVEILIDGDDSETVSLTVKNRGAIPDSLLPHLFDPMRRALENSPKSRAGGGMGLGLYTCRQIMLAHGGTIGVSSSESLGTAISATLPRQAIQRNSDLQDTQADARDGWMSSQG